MYRGDEPFVANTGNQTPFIRWIEERRFAVEYEISDQPQRGYKPERMPIDGETPSQDQDLLPDEWQMQ